MILTTSERGFGKPVAKLVPIHETDKDSFGSLEGTLTIAGDIVSPLDAKWEVLE